MDEAARELGIDPLELRLRNLARRGELFIPTDTPADGDWAQTVQRAAELIGWGTPAPPGRGRGIAVGIKSGPTTGLSYSTVRLLADGSVIVYAGTSDMGQGARTIFAQIAARGARRAARLGHRGHGRHRGRAVRPADVGQPLVRPDGQRHPARVPRRPGAAPDDGRPARGLDEAEIVVDRGEVRLGGARAADPRRARARGLGRSAAR